MFKKTRVRQIIELLQKNLSDREISNVLGVSRNSVARIRQVSDGYNGEWEELLMMTDDELYRFFYPDKFKPKNSYVPVDYTKGRFFRSLVARQKVDDIAELMA